MAKRYKAKVIGSVSDQLAVRIYNEARKGSPYNPGVSVDLANLIVAQARHETGDFTSNLFKKYNNAFGYAYYSGSNYQTGKGTNADNGQPIAAYGSIEASVNELVDWLYRRMREGKVQDLSTIHTPAQYAQALKSAGYYGDTLQNYYNGLLSFFKVISPGVNTAVILGLAAFLYIFRDNVGKVFKSIF